MFPTLSFGNEEIAPADLAARAAKAAGFLASNGLADGDAFAVMLRNQPTLLEIMLAARQLGAYFVPLNWHFTAAETGFILRDSGAKLLIIGGDLLPGVADGIPEDMPVYRVGPLAPGVENVARDWDAAVERAQPLHTSSDKFRGIVPYTSGTTGQPKGVRRIPQGDPAQVAERMGRMYQQALGVLPSSRCLISAPLYHSAPCSYVLLAARQGAWLRLEPRFDALETLAAIERFRITDAYLVPTMYVRLLRLTAAERRRYDLSSLRFVASTGAPCAAEVKRAMIDWWGDLINETYASSELGYLTAISSKEARVKPGSAGRPIDGVTIRILDEQGHEVADNTIGKIYARQTLMPSFTYINRQSDRDALEHGGFLTVGDIGYVDADGYLFVSDRRSDLVLSGGVNIYPAEIEAQLIAMPGVADCAVFGVPDPEFGQTLVAVIQPGDDVSLTAEQVRSFLATRLAGFKIPRTIEFRTQLPREDTGKIFKRKLRDEFAQALASKGP
ncbi:MAG: AMP-binding protein [Xanthobacteraceae bacterium]|nr:AMP-binding protein [Xanthobacteraceae bacterium]